MSLYLPEGLEANSPEGYKCNDAQTDLDLYIDYMYVYTCTHTGFILSPAWKGLTSLLSFVVSNCEFVTFPLVSWVRCGT